MFHSLKKSSVFVFVISMCMAFYTAKAFEPVVSVPQVGKLVALTFDDGIRPEIHEQMLDTLKEKSVPATFFLLGNQIVGNQEQTLVKRAIEEGHELGNHSMSHPKLPELSDDELKWEIHQFQQIMQEKYGYHPKVFRAPYLQYDERVMLHLQALHLTPINANAYTKDWSDDVDEEYVFRKATENLEPGSILLMHEVQKTANVLPRVIDFYHQHGYRFVTVSELLNRGGIIE